MVQVDVFWSFALGAGFAAAAARQIQSRDQTEGYKLLEDRYFTKNLIYLSCLFAPSGLYLVWRFTGWGTMYFFTGQTLTGNYDYERALPAWLVVLFGITNVTQGILGYWWASVYVRRNELFKAHFLWMAGYFLMFFILVHGWDGTGYRRFFTRNVAEWNAERAGQQVFGLWLALRWLVCPVALTLYAMGVVLLPLLFSWIADWNKRGYELADVDRARAMETSRGDLVKSVLRLTFLHTLGAAIFASLCIRAMGWIFGCALSWILGLGLALALIYFVLLRPGGPVRNEVSKITLE